MDEESCEVVTADDFLTRMEGKRIVRARQDGNALFLELGDNELFVISAYNLQGYAVMEMGWAEIAEEHLH